MNEKKSNLIYSQVKYNNIKQKRMQQKNVLNGQNKIKNYDGS